MDHPESIEKRYVNSPDTSYWLKHNIEVSQHRDILDAIRDAQALLTILELRYKNMREC